MLDIIFFGILAVILVFKLRSILGKENHEHLKEEMASKGKPIDITLEVIRNRKEAENKDPIAQVKPLLYSYNPVDKDIDKIIDNEAVQNFNIIKTKLGITEINFVQEFGEIFIKLINAYNEDKLDSIGGVISNNILQNMKSAIQYRRGSNLKERVILVKILNILVKNVQIKDDLATVFISVDSQQIHYVSDENEKIIDGSDTIPNLTHERFIVTRYLNKEDSGWIISEVHYDE